MNQKLQNATNLYMEGIRDGHVRQAVTKYTGERYTQHSTGVPDGIEGFVSFFDSFIERCPIRDISIIRSIVDGQYVFVQARQDINNGEAMWITTDLFDTDSSDKIIEHWDVISPLEVNTVGEEPQLAGPTQAEDHGETESNRLLIRDFIREVMILGDRDKLAHYVDTDALTVHAEADTPSLQDDIGRYDQIIRIIAEGNMVVAYCRVVRDSQEWARFDIFRVKNNRIEEHWINQELVPPKSEWANGGKF